MKPLHHECPWLHQRENGHHETLTPACYQITRYPPAFAVSFHENDFFFKLAGSWQKHLEKSVRISCKHIKYTVQT